jgi:ATP-dependent Clp protease protease subunit
VTTDTRIREQTFDNWVAERLLFNRSVEEITADFDRDRWFTADAAREYGFVDHVVHSVGAVAAVGKPGENH